MLAGQALMLAALSACSTGPDVIPKDMESQIDRSLSFSDLLRDPASHTGTTVLLGGEILSARRVKDRTELEILQLPVHDEDPPAWRRTDSQGRFLAVDQERHDPASYHPGTKVTIVGEVIGARTQQLDESDYRYPTVAIKHLHAWDEDTYQRRGRTSPSVGLGFGFGTGGGGSFGGIGIGTGF
jgi:outer membrane lipoprotein